MPIDLKERPVIMGRLLSRSMDFGECWIWLGPTNGVGYGQVSYKGRHTYTHRLSYMACRGDIPTGLYLDHLCRNKGCFRPDHLEPVTMRDNVLRALREPFTHCAYGHSWDEKNTYIIPSTGSRICRACKARNERNRRNRLKNRGI